jgi:hypothetical protein
MMESKGIDSQMVDVHLQVIMATNNSWMVPAGEDERRWCVLEVSDARAQDHAYFEAIADEMIAGGREALMYFLQNHDYSSINLREVPQTEALLDQKIQSLNDVGKYWLDTLRNGSLDQNWDLAPIAINTQCLYDAYQTYAGSLRSRHRVTNAIFGKELKRYCPSLDKQKCKTPAYGHRQHEYRLPEFGQCRTEFEDALGASIDWEEI